MRPSESNCNMLRVESSFPYVKVLMKGRPAQEDNSPKRFPMDQVHRAKIFSAFDALEGFSSLIRKANEGFNEKDPDRQEGNICRIPDDF